MHVQEACVNLSFAPGEFRVLRTDRVRWTHFQRSHFWGIYT